MGSTKLLCRVVGEELTYATILALSNVFPKRVDLARLYFFCSWLKVKMKNTFKNGQFPENVSSYSVL